MLCTCAAVSTTWQPEKRNRNSDVVGAVDLCTACISDPGKVQSECDFGTYPYRQATVVAVIAFQLETLMASNF
jgi:hypothetical protein